VEKRKGVCDKTGCRFKHKSHPTSTCIFPVLKSRVCVSSACASTPSASLTQAPPMRDRRHHTLCHVARHLSRRLLAHVQLPPGHPHREFLAQAINKRQPSPQADPTGPAKEATGDRHRQAAPPLFESLVAYVKQSWLQPALPHFTNHGCARVAPPPSAGGPPTSFSPDGRCILGQDSGAGEIPSMLPPHPPPCPGCPATELQPNIPDPHSQSNPSEGNPSEQQQCFSRPD